MLARKQTETLQLPDLAPGLAVQLICHRWHGGAGPSVYLQAALHADEIPPLLVAQRLEQWLDELAAAGRLRGDITLLPYANPTGLAQFVGGAHLGRFDLDSGINFNRGFPRCDEALVGLLQNRLGEDAVANVQIVRAALAEWLASTPPADPARALQHRLFSLAVQHDYVLDLHCDFEAPPHLYAIEAHWPELHPLAQHLGMAVTLLCDDSGGAAFDEACAGVFTTLGKRFPQHPLAPTCRAVTVELRGERDVSWDLAERDVAGLLGFLQQIGVLDGQAAVPTTPPRAVRLEAVDVVKSPAHGVLVWELPLGSEVRCGQQIGSVVPPGTQQVVPLHSKTDGLLFARRGHRWARAGQMVAKVAGAVPLAWRQSGALMYD